MTITLGLKGEQPLDVTERLDASYDLILAQELERDAFERVVEDVHIRLSNLDGALTGMMGSTKSAARWEVVIADFDPFLGSARTLFRGEIDSATIVFDVRQEYLDCTVFSLNRVFWDRTKMTRLRGQFSAGEQLLLYTTLGAVLDREIGARRVDAKGKPLFAGDLFHAIEIRNGLGAGRIRFCADANGNGAVGNNGMYCDLDPQTTVYDLLTAVCLYNNAECFIDPERNAFVFQKRSAVNNDRVAKGDPEAVISRRIIEDDPIELLPSDSEQYDYLYAPFEILRANAPVYVTQTLSTATQLGSLIGNTGGYLTYYLTNVIGGYESAPSLPTRVFMKPNAHRTGPGVNEWGSYHIFLDIPPGSSSTAKRRLYRTLPRDENTCRFLAEIAGNTETTFEDIYTDQPNIPLPADGPSATAAWFSFDETLGTWNAPILDYPVGVNEPFGRIFRVLPKLSFRNRNAPCLPASV